MAKAIASGRCIFMLCLSKGKRNKSRLGGNQTCQRIGAGFALYVRPSSSRGRAIWSDRESYSPFLLETVRILSLWGFLVGTKLKGKNCREADRPLTVSIVPSGPRP